MTVLLATSSAVTVKVSVWPAIVEAGPATTKCVTAPGLTVMKPVEKVRLFPASVAVIFQPGSRFAVFRKTSENVWKPLSGVPPVVVNVWFDGRPEPALTAPSVEVKATVPV